MLFDGCHWKRVTRDKSKLCRNVSIAADSIQLFLSPVASLSSLQARLHMTMSLGIGVVYMRLTQKREEVSCRGQGKDTESKVRNDRRQ
jgi:hypothetical protein